MERIVMQSRPKDYFKHLHSGLRTVKIAVYIATRVTLFNEGYVDILKVMVVLGIKMGPQYKQYADSYSADRIKRQERAC